MSKKINLVLIHGLLGSLSFFKPEKLLPNINIISPDLFGYGQSSLIENLSLQDQVDFVKEIIERETKEPCWILGHSVGGAIANLLSSQNPDLIRGLINVEGNYSLNDAFWCQSISDKTSQEWQEEYQTICNHPDQWLRDSNLALSPQNLKWAKDILDYQDADTVKAVANAVVKETNSNEYRNSIQKIIEHKIPTFLVSGEYSNTDWDIPSHVKDVAKGHYIIPNTGHMMMLDMPENFCQLLQQIIE